VKARIKRFLGSTGAANVARQAYHRVKSGAIVEAEEVSADSRIGHGAIVRSRAIVSHTTIGACCFVNTGAELYHCDVARYCSLGQYCQIGPNEHLMDYPTTCESLYPEAVWDHVRELKKERTPVGADVWVGSRAVILKGRRIGTGAVVAAGAIVTRDVPDYAIVGGIPAKVIRYRFDAREIELLLSSRWWEREPDAIRRALTSLGYPEQSADVERFCRAITSS